MSDSTLPNGDDLNKLTLHSIVGYAADAGLRSLPLFRDLTGSKRTHINVIRHTLSKANNWYLKNSVHRVGSRYGALRPLYIARNHNVNDEASVSAVMSAINVLHCYIAANRNNKNLAIECALMAANYACHSVRTAGWVGEDLEVVLRANYHRLLDGENNEPHETMTLHKDPSHRLLFLSYACVSVATIAIVVHPFVSVPFLVAAVSFAKASRQNSRRSIRLWHR